MYKQVVELNQRELFVWSNQPDYLHQMTTECDGDSPIATKYNNGEDGWTFHEPRPQKWNPYCDVKVIDF